MRYANSAGRGCGLAPCVHHVTRQRLVGCKAPDDGWRKTWKAPGPSEGRGMGSSDGGCVGSQRNLFAWLEEQPLPQKETEKRKFLEMGLNLNILLLQNRAREAVASAVLRILSRASSKILDLSRHFGASSRSSETLGWETQTNPNHYEQDN